MYYDSYDSMSRLKSASYSEDGTSNGHYSTSYTYDLQGNMETLTRKGMLDDKTYGLIDNLTYGYNGNQVVKITDKVQGPYYKDVMHFVDGANAATEYKYNKNGCMTQDLNKNILQIDYNLLNLPTKVTFSDGSVIAYGYDADGARLSADYNLSLMNVMKGNNGATQAGEPLLPFRRVDGREQGRCSAIQVQWKELDRMHGLDWHDYRARQLAVGRFTSTDPHATIKNFINI